MNRRQFLTRLPMIGVAVAVVAPVVAEALAVKPEFAMGGAVTPGVSYMVGESACETLLTPDQVRAMEDTWERHYHGVVGIPAHDPYIITNFNPAALPRGDAQPHKA